MFTYVCAYTINYFFPTQKEFKYIFFNHQKCSHSQSQSTKKRLEEIVDRTIHFDTI